MSNGRNFYTQIGITKKDRNEMSGCIATMIVIPIYLLINGVKLFCTIIVYISTFIVKTSKLQKIDKKKKEKQEEIKSNAINVNDKIWFREKLVLKIRVYQEDNYLFLENDCFKLKCCKLTNLDSYIFDYSLKWENGSYFGGNFGISCTISLKPFNCKNYNEYFAKTFGLAKQKYADYYKKEYNYFDKNPLAKKRH